MTEKDNFNLELYALDGILKNIISYGEILKNELYESQNSDDLKVVKEKALIALNEMINEVNNITISDSKKK